MDLEETVRYLIGESGPQLPIEEYEVRIDEMLERMDSKELLGWINIALLHMREGE